MQSQGIAVMPVRFPQAAEAALAAEESSSAAGEGGGVAPYLDEV
jgi:hypothetical protein